MLLISQCTVSKRVTSQHQRRSHKDVPHSPDSMSPDQSLQASPASGVVSQGIQEFKSADLNLAEWNFEQAITLDPNYGPAYYWLARVKFRQNETMRSLELLRRAADILSAHRGWMGRIEDFRLHIQTREAVNALE